jgi:hypothetical protein
VIAAGALTKAALVVALASVVPLKKIVKSTSSQCSPCVMYRPNLEDENVAVLHGERRTSDRRAADRCLCRSRLKPERRCRVRLIDDPSDDRYWYSGGRPPPRAHRTCWPAAFASDAAKDAVQLPAPIVCAASGSESHWPIATNCCVETPLDVTAIDVCAAPFDLLAALSRFPAVDKPLMVGVRADTEAEGNVPRAPIGACNVTEVELLKCRHEKVE